MEPYEVYADDFTKLNTLAFQLFERYYDDLPNTDYQSAHSVWDCLPNDQQYAWRAVANFVLADFQRKL
jgi:hypothetical protein